MPHPPRRHLAFLLAETLLSAPNWSQEVLSAHATELLGTKTPTWLPKLLRTLLQTFPQAPVRTPRTLRAWLQAQLPAKRKLPRPRRLLPKAYATMGAPRLAAPSLGPLPALASLGELAAWLELEATELDWFADPQARNTSPYNTEPRLQHYRVHWIPRRTGGLRCLEVPEPRLAKLQRKVLDELLARVPVHSAAQGFVAQRSIVTHAAQHCSQALVLCVDIEDYFPSIQKPRVTALFRRLGYPDSVATYLSALCTVATPLRSIPAALAELPTEHARRRQRLRAAHLPQGAPSSPMLANLCSFRLDRRLQGLALRFGLRYSRYADDLCFSGGAHMQRILPELRALITAILLDEGFHAHPRKHRSMSQARPQRVTGLVLNAHPAVPRPQRERMKALLYNCVRHGPASQNHAQHRDFRAWIMGQLSHIAHVQPRHAEPLRALFDQIVWPG